MITAACQRWREGRAAYRPARETVTTRALDVSSIDTDREARAFVEAHHYSRSYPAARFQPYPKIGCAPMRRSA